MSCVAASQTSPRFVGGGNNSNNSSSSAARVGGGASSGDGGVAVSGGMMMMGVGSSGGSGSSGRFTESGSSGLKRDSNASGRMPQADHQQQQQRGSGRISAAALLQQAKVASVGGEASFSFSSCFSSSSTTTGSSNFSTTTTTTTSVSGGEGGSFFSSSSTSSCFTSTTTRTSPRGASPSRAFCFPSPSLFSPSPVPTEERVLQRGGGDQGGTPAVVSTSSSSGSSSGTSTSSSESVFESGSSSDRKTSSACGGGQSEAHEQQQFFGPGGLLVSPYSSPQKREYDDALREKREEEKGRGEGSSLPPPSSVDGIVLWSSPPPCVNSIDDSVSPAAAAAAAVGVQKEPQLCSSGSTGSLSSSSSLTSDSPSRTSSISSIASSASTVICSSVGGSVSSPTESKRRALEFQPSPSPPFIVGSSSSSSSSTSGGDKGDQPKPHGFSFDGSATVPPPRKSGGVSFARMMLSGQIGAPNPNATAGIFSSSSGAPSSSSSFSSSSTTSVWGCLPNGVSFTPVSAGGVVSSSSSSSSVSSPSPFSPSSSTAAPACAGLSTLKQLQKNVFSSCAAAASHPFFSSLGAAVASVTSPLHAQPAKDLFEERKQGEEGAEDTTMADDDVVFVERSDADEVDEGVRDSTNTDEKRQQQQEAAPATIGAPMPPPVNDESERKRIGGLTTMVCSSSSLSSVSVVSNEAGSRLSASSTVSISASSAASGAMTPINIPEDFLRAHSMSDLDKMSRDADRSPSPAFSLYRSESCSAASMDSNRSESPHRMSFGRSKATLASVTAASYGGSSVGGLFSGASSFKDSQHALASVLYKHKVSQVLLETRRVPSGGDQSGRQSPDSPTGSDNGEPCDEASAATRALKKSCVDKQINAANTIANLALKKDNQIRLLECGAVERMIELTLTSSSRELHRFLAMSFCRLVQNASLIPTILNCDSFLQALVSLAGSANGTIWRPAARALSLCCISAPNPLVVIDAGALGFIQKLAKCDQLEFQCDALRALAKLSKGGAGEKVVAGEFWRTLFSIAKETNSPCICHVIGDSMAYVCQTFPAAAAEMVAEGAKDEAAGLVNVRHELAQSSWRLVDETLAEAEKHGIEDDDEPMIKEEEEEEEQEEETLSTSGEEISTEIEEDHTHQQQQQQQAEEEREALPRSYSSSSSSTREGFDGSGVVRFVAVNCSDDEHMMDSEASNAATVIASSS